MWNQTKITKHPGIAYPVMRGPFGGNLSSVELVATVSNACGLAGYGGHTLSPQEIIDIVK
jgi:nitronate monooxygenase